MNPSSTPKARLAHQAVRDAIKSGKLRGQPLREARSCKLSTGKEVILRINATFGRACGYPNGLRWIAFTYDSAPLGMPVSREEWPEFLDFFEHTLTDLSERLGVAFKAARDYQRALGTYVVEFHPRILPTEPIVIFERRGDN